MYYSIHDFMYRDLKLHGTDLNVFALVYSFKSYKGSLQSMCLPVGANSVTTIQYSLKRLVSQGFLLKEKSGDKFATCTYKVNFSNPLIPRNINVVDKAWEEYKGKNEVQIGVKL